MIDYAAKIESLFQKHMITYPLESQAIEAIAKLISAKTCLELGMYTGFTTAHLLRAVGEFGKVVGVDPVNCHDEAWFNSCPQFQYVNGYAPQCLSVLSGMDFDLVYFDGDCGGHSASGTIDQLRTVWTMSHPGSAFIFHDCQPMGVRGFPPGATYLLLNDLVRTGFLRGTVFPTPPRQDVEEAFGKGHEKELLPHLGIFLRTDKNFSEYK
jgi:hypothetical protein